MDYAFFVAKVKAYWELMKVRLSFLVSFSCAFGFVLASPKVNWITLVYVVYWRLSDFGGFRDN